jgi:lambda repressor-like predicted transcriptional regulator/predicted phosphodiesterase
MSTSRLAPHKEAIEAALNAGTSQTTLAKEHGVARSTLQAFIKRQINGHLLVVDDLSESPSVGYEEIPVFVRDYSDQDHHYIYPLGDVHIGSPAHAADRWSEWLGYLEGSDNASMLGTGDFLNSALKTSVSELYDEELRVGDAKRRLRGQLDLLAGQDKLDLLMPGNHEDRIYRAVGDCPIEDIADALGCYYARVTAIVVYRVGDVEYVVSVKHGTGGGQVGARANRLEKQANTIVADIYISGHTHSQLVFPRDLFIVEDQRVVRRRQLFVSSGSFLNAEEYALKMGYTPQKLGAPRIRLNGARHDAHVSV